MIKTLIYGAIIAFFVVQTANIPPLGIGHVANAMHVASIH